MSHQFDIRNVSRDEYSSWDEAVADSIGGSPYSTSGYLRALCNVAGGEYRLMAVCEDARIVGGIGLYVRQMQRREYVRGRYLLYYNGPFVRRLPNASVMAAEEYAYRVLERLEERLRCSDYRPVDITLRHSIKDCRPFLKHGWQARPTYSYEVDISDPETCFSSMHRNVRRQIRQAERASLFAGQSDDIAGFFRLHEQTCRRKGFPTYLEKDKMISFYDELKKEQLGRLYLAGESDAMPTAGVLVLTGGHKVSHTVCAASSDGKLPPGVNAWLRWHVFKDLSASGYSGNDLTDAHEPAVAKFKRQLGARLIESQRLSLPQTATDHLRIVNSMWIRSAKDSIKRVLRSRGGK